MARILLEEDNPVVRTVVGDNQRQGDVLVVDSLVLVDYSDSCSKHLRPQ